MPWEIKKQNDKYCVVKSDTDEVEKCHGLRADATKHMAALYANVKEVKPEFDQLIVEAAIAKTGSQWEVTIIGAKSPGDVLTIDGRQFVASDNGRLGDCLLIPADDETEARRLEGRQHSIHQFPPLAKWRSNS